MIDYKALRQQNAAALATLRAEQAEHLETHPELLVAQARRLAGQTKIVERSASDVLDMVYKRNDNSLIHLGLGFSRFLPAHGYFLMFECRSL